MVFMEKYEEKFIVINKKHLEIVKKKVPDKADEFIELLRSISNWLPNNKYYVCNQDELYAQQIIDIIIAGENAKKRDIK